MKIWDYAEMAKAAKKLGGPEKYADFLVNSGRNQMVPLVIGGSLVSLGVGVAGTIGVSKLVKFIEHKNEEKGREVAMAKEELIKLMEEYNEKEEELTSEQKKQRLNHPSQKTESRLLDKVIYVDISKVQLNEDNLEGVKGEDLDDFVEYYKNHGVMEPLIVYNRKSHYEIIAGARRLRAAQIAGIKEVPILVFEDENEVEHKFMEEHI